MKTAQESHDRWVELDNKRVEAESLFKTLESQTKTIFSRNLGTEGAMELRKNYAYKSPEYVNHINTLNIAREEFLKAEAIVNHEYQNMLILKQQGRL